MRLLLSCCILNPGYYCREAKRRKPRISGSCGARNQDIIKTLRLPFTDMTTRLPDQLRELLWVFGVCFLGPPSLCVGRTFSLSSAHVSTTTPSIASRMATSVE